MCCLFMPIKAFPLNFVWYWREELYYLPQKKNYAEYALFKVKSIIHIDFPGRSTTGLCRNWYETT